MSDDKEKERQRACVRDRRVQKAVQAAERFTRAPPPRYAVFFIGFF